MGLYWWLYRGRLKKFWFVYKGGKTNIFIIIKNVFLNISGGILCGGVLFKHVRGFVLGGYFSFKARR